jgi:hypothetical protein
VLGLLLGAVGWAVGYGAAVVAIDFLLGGRPARGVLVAPAVIGVVLAGAVGALGGLALGWRLPRRLVRKRGGRPRPPPARRP